MIALKYKKVTISFYYIILFCILQVLGVFLGVKVAAEEPEQDLGFSLTETQKNTIIDHCDTIKDSLKSLQRVDSRTRVYLGRYYETILTNFITPLNLRLVENNISNTRLLDNQANFAAKRGNFVNDFISYQQALEETINVDCKKEPVRFYEKLTVAREKRKNVNKDVNVLRKITDEQVKLVENLKNGE